MAGRAHTSSAKSFKSLILTFEQEVDCANRYRETRDERAIHALILSQGNLIRLIKKQYRNFGIPAEDIEQQAYLGLMQAARRFDPAKGFRFFTFARWWVKASVRDYVFANARIVRPSSSVAGKKAFFSGANAPDFSLDARYKGEGEPLLDSLIWTDPSADEAIADDQGRQRIRKAVTKLPAREKHIITERYLSESGASLEEIGGHFGVSKERIRQLEQRAINKLREMVPA